MRQKIAKFKKEIILEIASKKFQKYGFKATSINQIITLIDKVDECLEIFLKGIRL